MFHFTVFPKNREKNRKCDIIHVKTVQWPVDETGL